MPLIFVTGASAAGKSTVRAELDRRGFSAFDTDEDAIAQWRNKVTGALTPAATEAHRDPEFIAQHDWIADPQRICELADLARDRPVFLCGLVGNEDEVWTLFDKVILLSIDEPTMRRRLVTRTEHDFGKSSHELDLLIAWRAMVDDHYAERGAVSIDAMQPVSLIVDDILSVLATGV